MSQSNGSWQIARGVFNKLRINGVEDAIKQKYWSNQINDPSNFRAIWKNRARPNCQMPYAVYSVISDTKIGQSTGTGAEKQIGNDPVVDTVSSSGQAIQYRQSVIQFACYANSDGKSDESWAIDVASMIVDAVENGKLEFNEGTRFINLIRESDIELRDDDDNSLIIISWQVDYELLMNMDRLLA